MSVITVQGVIDSNDLGIISPHEHVFIDIRNQFTNPSEAAQKALSKKNISITNLDVLSRNPYALLDNLVLNNFNTAEKELMRFKKAGGDTIVDATSIGIGRDPRSLMAVSRTTGINIIMGCGYYTFDTHPPDMNTKTVEEIRDEILSDITVGIGDTHIRAGVIGELGTSEEIHPNEVKVLKASGKAHIDTNVGIIVHTYPWANNGFEIIDILIGEGVPPEKISINHVDVEIDIDYCSGIAEKGAFFEFDDFGKEYYIDRPDRGFAGGVFARDIERVRALKILIDKGHLGNILISCDICLKTLLHRYGGWGYDHILTHIVPMMHEVGISDEEIESMIRDNPHRFVAV